MPENGAGEEERVAKCTRLHAFYRADDTLPVCKLRGVMTGRCPLLQARMPRASAEYLAKRLEGLVVVSWTNVKKLEQSGRDPIPLGGNWGEEKFF